MNNGDLISREALKKDMCKICNEYYSDEPCEPSDCIFFNAIKNAPAVDAVEVKKIKAYLQSKLDEWDALGDIKFEPANMWGYNFIMACFDDLARMDGE